jgi:LDH2 family malate/lactate/ureidoglycolate dehydrogenase
MHIHAYIHTYIHIYIHTYIHTGVEGMMGTNPLTFGIPTDEPYPFVIDCATSVNQRGKIEKYAREGTIVCIHP